MSFNNIFCRLCKLSAKFWSSLEANPNEANPKRIVIFACSWKVADAKMCSLIGGSVWMGWRRIRTWKKSAISPTIPWSFWLLRTQVAGDLCWLCCKSMKRSGFTRFRPTVAGYVFSDCDCVQMCSLQIKKYYKEWSTYCFMLKK